MQESPMKSTDTELLAYHLIPTLEYLCHRYTVGLSLPPQLPAQLRRSFFEDLTGFDRTMATALSQQMVTAFDTDKDMDEAVGSVAGEFQAQVNRLSNFLWKSDLDFQSYLALSQISDYPYYLFLSEKGDTTCERCSDRHGDLFTLADVTQPGAFPPLHPNCRCRLVALDEQMARLYVQNKPGVVSLLEGALEERFGRAGGLYYLPHQAWLFGIAPEQVRLSGMSAISDLEHSQPGWMEELKQWALKFGSDAVDFIDAFIQRGQMLFPRAADMLKENPILGLTMWADALLGGIPSGFLEGFVQRWEEAKANASVDTVMNFLTLGMNEMFEGAIHPEEPWSFQHFMDMVGLLTFIYGAVKGIKGAMGADDLAGMADDGLANLADDAAGYADDLVDDALSFHEPKYGLPNVEQAIIDPRKILEYSLNPTHIKGGDKAVVFKSVLGFDLSTADGLIAQIYKNLPKGEAILGLLDQYGQRYTVDLLITGPNGNTAIVRTGWIIRVNSTVPTLTTAFIR